MKVKELLNTIKQLKADGSITDETELIYSSDDEGNSFQTVSFGPEVMYFDEAPNEFGYFSQDSSVEGPTKHKFLCVN